jgi:hypothetical protein
MRWLASYDIVHMAATVLPRPPLNIVCNGAQRLIREERFQTLSVGLATREGPVPTDALKHIDEVSVRIAWRAVLGCIF